MILECSEPLKDHRLPYQSDELNRLRVDMMGISETRRPGSGKTSRKRFTYHWS